MGLIACVAGHGTDRLRRGAVEGGTIWWVAPTNLVGNMIWRLLKRACGDACAAIHEVEKRMDFFGGGSVTVKTAESPRGLRGEGLDGLVIDESAFLDEDLWQLELRPALSDKQGWVWFISTPNGMNWFEKLYRRALATPEWSAWQGPTTTATVPQSELDAARAELGSYAFNQEYLAQFVQAGGGFFKREYFRYYHNDCGIYRLLAKAEACQESTVIEADKCRKFQTMDLAASTKTSADYTVVSTFAVPPDSSPKKKNLILLDVQRARMEGPEQVPMLLRGFNRWKPDSIQIESVGYQLALIQAAKKEGLPIKELKRDKDKISRASFLQARMEGGDVWFPDNASWMPALEEELCAFPNGDHDDQVDTLSDGAIHVTTQSTFKVW